MFDPELFGEMLIDDEKQTITISLKAWEELMKNLRETALLAAAVVALAGDVATGLELDRIKTGNSGLYSSTLNKHAPAIELAKGLVG